jgi:hypothetical protein
LATISQTKKATTTKECTSVAGHFDGHADTWVQGCLYCLMQHVLGYTGSLWMPPLGNYLLHITTAAARATGKKTTINKYT